MSTVAVSGEFSCIPESEKVMSVACPRDLHPHNVGERKRACLVLTATTCGRVIT